MAELKEIKGRLQSVRSTQKITSAMMMVSSSKLHKAQQIISDLYPYEQKLYYLLQILLNQQEELVSPFIHQRPVERVAIVAFSSNSSLAGRFNDDITDKLQAVVASYRHLGNDNILIYPIGDKVAKATRNMGLEAQGNFTDISEKPAYKNTQSIADELTNMFLDKTVDRVELIYHHFRSKGSQVIVHEPYLPVNLKSEKRDIPVDQYIIDPDSESILHLLIPKVLRLKLYTIHSDSVTSEHAARMTAMQIATDNADNMIEDLKLEYNKLRQESITNELLDIIGGSFGRSS
ncbi:MAG: ATP synthase F1 subunit gamma [Proteiniphilum sp.]|nr:ATP synthase F1 subunit gamma [Proteiniphilum sp.]MDD3778754.1 ATP synthase F1 subunit gamma [Proteiniphilum sp.]MDD4452898.1 ATP synthase F1 subunit gamma [Proteiniphilum sp.]